jgi:hypothetical protein
LSSLPNSSAWAVMSKVVVGCRWLRSASLVSSRAPAGERELAPAAEGDDVALVAYLDGAHDSDPFVRTTRRSSGLAR